MTKLKYLIIIVGLLGFLNPVWAAPAVSYGPDIDLAHARKLAAVAATEAERMKLRVAIAIVDTAGHLVYFEKADDTQTASVEVSIAKARSASNFRRPTKVFEDALNGGRTSVLGLPGAVPVEGGVPLVREGRIIGAIGISGLHSSEDHALTEFIAEQVRSA
jgi:uncharacterized protein GlcG (DUF336 family)